MASTSSINSGPRSRPNQPPPPPPLPSVPPVPPTRDSSIAISRATISKQRTPIPPPHSTSSQSNHRARSFTTTVSNQISANPMTMATPITNGDAVERVLSQFEPLFKPISELPPPDPFINKPKTYPSQRAQQKQIAPLAP